MIRGVVTLAVAGLVLSACGTVSLSRAMTSWATQSSYLSNSNIVLTDARHAATALHSAGSSTAQLHTVCAVLLVDVGYANASLPTPDGQATTLLSKAYTDLAAGANECYKAQSDVFIRTRALTWLASGAFSLSEASARIATASRP